MTTPTTKFTLWLSKCVKLSCRHVADVWAKLRGDDDFKNLDSAKLRQLLSVSLAELSGTAVLVALGCSGLMKGIPGGDEGITHLNIVLTFACAISLVITVQMTALFNILCKREKLKKYWETFLLS